MCPPSQHLTIRTIIDISQRYVFQSFMVAMVVVVLNKLSKLLLQL
jgi:hypothetical protein